MFRKWRILAWKKTPFGKGDKHYRIINKIGKIVLTTLPILDTVSVTIFLKTKHYNHIGKKGI